MGDGAVGPDDAVAAAVPGHRHADHRRRVGEGPGRAVELGVTEGEHTAVVGHEQVALARGRRDHPDDRPVELDVPGRAVEAGVTEGEDPAVAGQQPVAPTGGRGRHADDRPVEGDVARGAVEAGVTEGEDAAVVGHHPVPTARRGRGHADDRLVELQVAGRTVERGVEGEDPTVGGHEPVTPAFRAARHGHDRLVQGDVAGRPVELGVAVAEDAAVPAHEPVALTGGRWRRGARRRVRVRTGVRVRVGARVGVGVRVGIRVTGVDREGHRAGELVVATGHLVGGEGRSVVGRGTVVDHHREPAEPFGAAEAVPVDGDPVEPVDVVGVGLAQGVELPGGVDLGDELAFVDEVLDLVLRAGFLGPVGEVPVGVDAEPERRVHRVPVRILERILVLRGLGSEHDRILPVRRRAFDDVGSGVVHRGTGGRLDVTGRVVRRNRRTFGGAA